MTDMKCPFCQQRLDADDLLFSCINENCEESFDMVGTALLWQEFISAKKELDRTKKQLEIALTCMNGVTKDLPWVKRALEQITALEQKDVKNDLPNM